MLGNASSSDCFDQAARPVGSDSTIWLNSAEYRLTGSLLNIVSMGQDCASGKSSGRDAVWVYDHDETREIVTGFQLVDGDRDNPAGTCNPSKTYQWGFSFLLLFITSVMNAVVFLMLHFLHSWTYHYSYLGRTARQQPGMWRAVVDLSVVAGIRRDRGMLYWPNAKLEKEMADQKMTFRLRPSQAKDLQNVEPEGTLDRDIELRPLNLSFPGRLTIE